MRFGGFEPLLAAGALGHQDVCLRLLFVFCSGAETAREIEVTKFDANRRAVGMNAEEPYEYEYYIPGIYIVCILHMYYVNARFTRRQLSTRGANGRHACDKLKQLRRV